jgi:hypothetical protein
VCRKFEPEDKPKARLRLYTGGRVEARLDSDSKLLNIALVERLAGYAHNNCPLLWAYFFWVKEWNAGVAHSPSQDDFHRKLCR